MLWTLLTTISSATFIVGAMISAKHARAGLGGYAFAIAIGLLLGACSAWALYAVGDAVADRSKRYSESVQEWCFRALYLAAAVWIPFAAFLGNWVTSVAMRFVL
jgi:hypothetical protein